jgi:hypothetical protein
MTDSPMLDPAPDPAPTLAPARTSATADRPPSRKPCGDLAGLPPVLVSAALMFAPRDPDEGGDDVMRLLRCPLERYHEGQHYTMVRDLTGVDTGSVWTRWWSDERPATVLVLPDCGAHSAGRRRVCEEFAGHPGGHTWELDDPWGGSPE